MKEIHAPLPKVNIVQGTVYANCLLQPSALSVTYTTSFDKLNYSFYVPLVAPIQWTIQSAIFRRSRHAGHSLNPSFVATVQRRYRTPSTQQLTTAHSVQQARESEGRKKRVTAAMAIT